MADNTGTLFPEGAKDQYQPNRGPAELPHLIVDISRSKCLGDRPVITVSQGQVTRLVLWVFDTTGAAVDLSTGGPFSAKLIAREREQNPQNIFSLTCTLPADPTELRKGMVRCNLSKINTKATGLFMAQLGIYNAAGTSLYFASPYWLQVTPTLDYRSWGPITIAEVRLMLRDVCPSQNFLLDDFEFDDSQIAACMRWPLDEFNEKYQPKTNYTAKSFPWRFHWLRGTCGYLLEIASRGYARDHLDYNAGGIAVNDKNKFGLYAELAKQLLQDWRTFVKERKLELNIDGGFGNLGSGYNYSNYR